MIWTKEENGQTGLAFVIKKKKIAFWVPKVLTGEASSGGQHGKVLEREHQKNPTDLLSVMWLICFTGFRHIC